MLPGTPQLLPIVDIPQERAACHAQEQRPSCRKVQQRRDDAPSRRAPCPSLKRSEPEPQGHQQSRKGDREDSASSLVVIPQRPGRFQSLLRDAAPHVPGDILGRRLQNFFRSLLQYVPNVFGYLRHALQLLAEAVLVKLEGEDHVEVLLHLLHAEDAGQLEDLAALLVVQGAFEDPLGGDVQDLVEAGHLPLLLLHLAPLRSRGVWENDRSCFGEQPRPFVKAVHGVPPAPETLGREDPELPDRLGYRLPSRVEVVGDDVGRFRIWSDQDGDGRFEDHELATLDEAGIESIGLSYTEQRTDDENGNQVVRTGQFVWSDGKRGKASEFLLGRDTIHSLVGEKMDEPNDVAALPDLPGRGFLYSLHQAMVRDGSGELKRLTEQFAGEKDSAACRSLLERILLKWSEVSNVETTPNEGWLGFLEKFYGARYNWSSLTNRGRRQLESTYESVSLYLYGKMLGQSHYAEKLEILDYDMDDTGRIFLSTHRALESLVREHVANPDQLKRSLGEFFLVLRTAGLYDYVDEAEVESVAAKLSQYGLELSDACRASYLAMKGAVGMYTLPVFGAEQGGLLEGDQQNNVLVGGSGADVLKGGHGADILMSGAGADVMEGGVDSDVYVWNLGDGNDRIVNSSTGSGEEDVLRLGRGIHAENVKVERHGNTILLHIGESGEVLTLATDTSLNGKLDAADPSLQIARVEFADKNKQGCRIEIHSANLVPVDCY